MITKEILAEQIKRILKGGDYSVDAEISLQELMIYVNQAYSSVIRRRYFEVLQIEGEKMVNGAWIYTVKGIPVQLDTDCNLHYIELPASYVDLPYNTGLYSVSLAKDQRHAFIPTPTSFLSMYDDNMMRVLGDRTYYIEGNKIIFPTMDTKPKCDIMIKLVGSVEHVDECDGINIAPDIQEEIVRMGVQLYINQVNAKEDLANDNIK